VFPVIDRTFEILKLRSDLAALAVQVSLIKLQRQLKAYNPDQPRVPAGSSSGGQWTGGSTGGSSGDASEPSSDLGAGTDLDEGRSAGGPEFGQAIVERRNEKTGNAFIDGTTDKLVDIMKDIVEKTPAGSGSLYGIEIHTAFARALREANLPGIGMSGVEQSFFEKEVADYGVDRSIRTDVVLRDPVDLSGKPIAVWDVKTGSAVLAGRRVEEIRYAIGVEDDVPVIEFHITRGITIKAIAGGIPIWIIRVVRE
jgi:hypothetical protein